jgi:hypothetical protein
MLKLLRYLSALSIALSLTHASAELPKSDPVAFRKYEVLIASPGDVSTERQILIECIEDWNSSQSEHVGAILLPRRWELDVFPEMGARAQEIINKQVVEKAIESRWN